MALEDDIKEILHNAIENISEICVSYERSDANLRVPDKIDVSFNFTPISALRCITINIPINGVFKNFDRHKAYNTKVKHSKTGATPWFKDGYDRIGRGRIYGFK